MRTNSIAVLILLSLPTISSAADDPARVVDVTDGETSTVLAAGNRHVKIRLDGVDAPETGQDFGSQAKQAPSLISALLRTTGESASRPVREGRDSYPDGFSRPYPTGRLMPVPRVRPGTPASPQEGR